MTTQHTPGPWDLDMGKYRAAISNGGTIAKIDDTMTDWKANARLIAAAPDLLEVAYLLLEMANAPNPMGQVEIKHQAIALAKTAILKVQGA